MTLAAVRTKLGLSQEAFAVELGLKPSSKSWICDIEGGKRPASLRLAMKIEQYTNGEVSAASICPIAASLGA